MKEKDKQLFTSLSLFFCSLILMFLIDSVHVKLWIWKSVSFLSGFHLFGRIIK